MPKPAMRAWRTRAVGAGTAAWLLAGLAAGCGGGKSGGELHARRVLLEREVEGLRASVAKLERGEPLFPEEALLVSIGDGVVKEFVDAQLPLKIALDAYAVELKTASASFKGSPTLSLTGTIVHKDHPDLIGEVSAIGALDTIEVDPGTGTLRAKVAVDHVGLLKVGGFERFLAGGTVDELARAVRKQLEGRIPPIEIPVKIEQGIDLPSVTQGPVRLRGATMPLAVSVADVVAGQGVLWIAIRVVPGDLTRSPEGQP